MTGLPALRPLLLGAVGLLAVGLGAGLSLWLEGTVPPATGLVAPTPLPLATETDILAAVPEEMSVYRFAQNADIVVLRFRTLRAQGSALNRMAALFEKRGLPRDRVLDDDALSSAIQAVGARPETFYIGHNYRALDLSRFFELADRDGVQLNAEEQRLRGFLQELGWLQKGAGAALISIAGTTNELHPAELAATLRHELSHGEYFTRIAYAAYVRSFWADVLTAEERTKLRRFLSDAGYDETSEDLMANEMQAFLVHTPDTPMFQVSQLGLTPARVASLRDVFLAGMPSGWLRDAASPRR